MKILHTADLHIGKCFCGWSLIEEQAAVLAEILEIANAERPDAVLLAGDLYDKPVPSTQAVLLFDRFLSDLQANGHTVFMTSGNHDAPERVAFAGEILRQQQVFCPPAFDGAVAQQICTDAYGAVRICMLPYLRLSVVRRAFPDAAIETVSDAYRRVLATVPPEPQRRILLAHGCVLGGLHCESDDTVIGGADNIDPSVFDGFTYTALGHLHGAQSVGRDTVHYAGSPLKYSFSEELHRKSVTVTEIDGAGACTVRTVPLHTPHDIKTLHGSFAELMNHPTDTDCYVRFILTDKTDIPDANRRLGTVYPRICNVLYEGRASYAAPADTPSGGEGHSPCDTAFAQLSALYEGQNGTPLSDTQARFAQALIQEVFGEDE